MNAIEPGSKRHVTEPPGYVEFFATGTAVAGAFRCAECGYGVAVRSVLPICPMCGGRTWEESPRGTYARSSTRPFF